MSIRRLLVLLVLLVLMCGPGHGAVEVPPLWSPPLTTPAGEVQDDQVVPPRVRETPAPVVDGSGEDPTLGAPVPVLPSLPLTVPQPGDRAGMSNAVKLLLLITVLAIAPGFLMMMTSFTRIVIVLGFVRKAVGTQTLPPNQVLLGLSLFLTLFVMAPTFRSVHEQAIEPYMQEQLDEQQAFGRAKGALRDFMIAHTRKTDLALFVRIAGAERPHTAEDVSFTTLVPAFITSELKTAFQMGFIIFLPFLVIDLVIAAVLMALGMMMLPPVIVSLPFKILLFVLVDGWALLIHSLAASYA